MADEKDPYELHLDDDADDEPRPSREPEAREKSSASEAGTSEPIGLEGAKAPRSKRPAEPCPSCGAPMSGSDTLLCLRCGFDLKTLKSHRTAATTEEVDEASVDDEERPRVVSQEGRGGVLLALGIAAAGALILVIGYLAGADGLFPALTAVASGDAPPAEVAIGFGTRLVELGRFAVLAAVLVSCGVAALLALAMLWRAELGDVQLAVARIVALVMAARLVSFIDLGSRSAEWTVEMLLQAVIWLVGAMLLLRLNARDAVLYGLLTLMSLGGLWLLGQMVAWALPG